MTLFILTETSAGYALLKAKDKKLLKRDDLSSDIETAEGVCTELKLKQFLKFSGAASALEECAAISDSKVTPMLTNLLVDTLKEEKKVSLAVQDVKLGNAINKLPGLSISIVSDSSTADLYRAIRTHLTSLIPGLMPEDVNTMNLGLSHSLSRHKLRFSPDKVDTMIIQAIGLLDDLDKELNTYAMRVREWYGWHYPELAKILNDNLAYARVVLDMGMRSSAKSCDLSAILPEEIETAVKAAAEVSMGTEIEQIDLDNIRALAEQVVEFTLYRQQLSSYLSARMQAIAPNLTSLVGELVGARLIAHSGSLLNLAKSPGSTIQILGAEKALFRALKTKHDTPKYGLIYHASLVGQATGRNKGKLARMLASKTALGLRIDGLSDWGASGEGKGVEPTDEEKSAWGNNARSALEKRLRALEGKPLRPTNANGTPMQATKGKWEVKEARKYNADADGLTGNEPAAKRMKSNGVKATNGAAKMIEEVTDESEDKDEDMDRGAGADESEEEDLKASKKENQGGAELSKAEKKAQKAAEKEAKRARKAERAAKRDAKASKKEKKDSKKDSSKDGKKRKREDEAEGEKAEKKKKKKSKD